MADIFLSYASEDRELIEPLVEILEAQGWTLWWDRELIAGPSFAQRAELLGAGRHRRHTTASGLPFCTDGVPVRMA
jgi:hypothetical protein